MDKEVDELFRSIHAFTEVPPILPPIRDDFEYLFTKIRNLVYFPTPLEPISDSDDCGDADGKSPLSQPSMPCLSSMIQNLENVVPETISAMPFENGHNKESNLDHWFNSAVPRARRKGFSRKLVQSGDDLKPPFKENVFLMVTKIQAKSRF